MKSRLLLALTLSVFTFTNMVSAADFAAQGKEILTAAKTFFADKGNRFPGSEANEKTSLAIGKIFKNAADECGTTTFEQPVFVAGKASVTVGERNIAMYAMLPNMADLGNFKKEKFSGKIFYVGKGNLKDLDGRNLKGSLCLFDFDCGRNYYNAIKNGAKGCLFVEPDRNIYSYYDACEKVSVKPLTIPRYQISKEDGEYLKQAAAGVGGIDFSADVEKNRWERKQLKNHWALIEGTDPELKKQMVILHAHYDSLHYCPQLSGGAVDAMNLKLLLDLFGKYSKNRPVRSIFFHVTNSYNFGSAGLRESAFHLFGRDSEIFADQITDKSEKKVNEDIVKESDYIIKGYETVSPENISKSAILAEVSKEAILNVVSGLDSSKSKDELLASLNEEDTENVVYSVIKEKIEKIRDTYGAPANKTIPLADEMVKLLDSEVFVLSEEKSRLIRQNKLTPELEKQFAEKISKYDKIITMFNTYGSVSTYRDLTPVQRNLFEDFRRNIVKDARKDKERAELRLSWLDDVERARTILKEKQLYPLVAFDFAFDFSSDWLGMTLSVGGRWVRDLLTFRNRVGIYSRELKGDTGISWASVIDDAYHYRNAKRNASRQYFFLTIPAFTIASPFGSSLYQISSYDNFDSISESNVGKKFYFIDKVFDKIIADENIADYLAKEEDGKYVSKIPSITSASGQFVTKHQDGSSIDEPSVVLPDTLIIIRDYNALYRDRGNMVNNPFTTNGMYNFGLEYSDASGRAFYYNLELLKKTVTYQMEAYHIGKDGQIDMAIDQGATAKKYDSNLILEIKNGYKDRHMLALFECGKADLYDLFAPRRSMAISRPQFQKPNGGIVKWYSTSFINEPLAGYPWFDGAAPIFMVKQDRHKIIFSNNVCLVNSKNIEEKLENSKWQGIGFLASEIDRKSVPELCSKDVVGLNSVRIALLKDNAVTDRLMENLHEKSKNFLYGNSEEEPKAVSATDDFYNKFIKVLNVYGSAFGAYPVVLTTNSDMMKAVVFYLAVLIPFCFFLQKLVFTFTRIETQISVFAILFFLTYFIFHYVHPAFEIAKNPQIVLVAFVMMVLACFVAFCMKGKFDYHMASFKERFSKEEDVGILKLAGTAMLIGVTNMKRRKLRTFLTCATIVLITFTMLSFTSVSQSVAPTRIKKAEETPYNGIFYSRQSWAPLEANKEKLMDYVVGEGYEVLRRSFQVFSANAYRRTEAALFMEGSKSPVAITGVLALEQKEDGWIVPMRVGAPGSPLIAGRFFSDDSAREIIVTDQFANKTLGYDFTPGSKELDDVYITFDGVKLKLVGIVDGEMMSKVKDLRGNSIIPQQQVETGANLQGLDQRDEEMELPEGSFQDIGAQFYVIVPFDTGRVYGASTRSVSVKMPDAQSVWDRVMEYVYLSSDKVYFGTDDKFAVVKKTDKTDAVYEMPGRYYLGSGFETSIGGLSSLIIPLLISASIIFNTMLGSVYERNKEIGIFNAIGLNPIHIALFFVAEAIVYGILGGVGGYLIGQVLANIIVYLGVLGGVNLNYSSLTVVYVIMFTILIVILSTLYPAMMAMRTASSSSGRKKPKQTDDNTLEVAFPYSFTREMAIAVNSYIKEYFDLHMDSSVGDFVATPEGSSRNDEVEGDKLVMTLKYKVALAPYDLGVTQEVIITTVFNEEVGAFMVCANTVRISGMDKNWLATNKPFLNGIRKYLLYWRVLEEQGQKSHMENGFQMFDLDK